MIHLVVALALSLCAHLTIEPGCRCDFARLHNGWCQQDAVGFLAGVEVPSFTLVEALDPEGHPVDTASLECAGCRAAAEVNGMCETCGRGIKDGRIYASKLTYYLALGEPRSATSEGKHAHSGDAGWCDRCGVGWVGPVSYHDRPIYEAALREYKLLRVSVDTLPRCESCAVACYFGTYCPLCNLAYKDGVAIKDGWSALKESTQSH